MKNKKKLIPAVAVAAVLIAICSPGPKSEQTAEITPPQVIQETTETLALSKNIEEDIEENAPTKETSNNENASSVPSTTKDSQKADEPSTSLDEKAKTEETTKTVEANSTTEIKNSATTSSQQQSRQPETASSSAPATKDNLRQQTNADSEKSAGVDLSINAHENMHAESSTPKLMPDPEATPEPEPTPAPEPESTPEPEPASEPTPEPTPTLEISNPDGHSYVLNTNTHKFHYPNCPSANDIKSSNREDVDMDREAIIAMGYNPCKKCNP